MDTCEFFMSLGYNKLNKVNGRVLSYLDCILSYSSPASKFFALSDLGKSLGIALLASLNYYLFGFTRNEIALSYLPPEAENLTSFTTIG